MSNEYSPDEEVLAYYLDTIEPTGTTGRALVLGSEDGPGAVLDRDPRNAFLTYCLEGVGPSLEYLEFDQAASTNLELWWVAGARTSEDPYFTVLDSEVLLRDVGAGTYQEELEEIDPWDRWPELYPLHLGLRLETCTHRIVGPARSYGLSWSDLGITRCLTCGGSRDRGAVLYALKDQVLKRTTLVDRLPN